MINILEKLKEVVRRMVAYDSIEDTLSTTVYSSKKMDSAIDLWERMYEDDAPWLDDYISSLNLGATICESMAMMVLAEMESRIEGNDFLADQYERHVLPHLSDELEKAMAVGGMVARPYVTKDEICVDFCRQGQFLPISFDDDGNLYDVAFFERITKGDYYLTRVERQTFDKSAQKVTIETKAYMSKSPDSVGDVVSLENVEEWSYISPVVEIPSDAPLFGFYKVPKANKIDLDSPLGISVFATATNLIKKADEQFSRLDWEYEGGQLAVEVSEDAIPPEGRGMDELGERIYRPLDFDSNDTYHVFNPSLRDTNYIAGLDKYLMRIEDNVGLARGTLSESVADARTATEIRILKQKTYITVTSHQKAIDQMLEGLVNAMSVLAGFYEIGSSENYEIVTEWKDSVLTDTSTELDERLKCIEAGIDSKEETRAWRKGEDLETARERIAEITASQGSGIEDAFKGLM